VGVRQRFATEFDLTVLPPSEGEGGDGGEDAWLPPPTRTLPRQGAGEVFAGDVHDIPTPVSPRQGGGD
jgi:hypothetical protein